MAELLISRSVFSFLSLTCTSPLNDVMRETRCFTQSTACRGEKNAFTCVYDQGRGSKCKPCPLCTEITKGFHWWCTFTSSGSFFSDTERVYEQIGPFARLTSGLKTMMRFRSTCVCQRYTGFAFSMSKPVRLPWISNKLVVALTPSGFQMLTTWLSRTSHWRERRERETVSIVSDFNNPGTPFYVYRVHLRNVQTPHK